MYRTRPSHLLIDTWLLNRCAACTRLNVVTVVDELAQSVGTYLAAGFNRCEPAVVIATPEHWSRFAERLAFRGWGEKELEDEGCSWLADADETLAAIMVDGSPSRDCFEQCDRWTHRSGRGARPGSADPRVRGDGRSALQRGDPESAAALERSGTDLRSGEVSRSSAPITSTSSIGRRRQRSCPRSAGALARSACRGRRTAPAGSGRCSRRDARAGCRQGLRADVGRGAEANVVPTAQLALMWVSARCRRTPSGFSRRRGSGTCASPPASSSNREHKPDGPGRNRTSARRFEACRSIH